MARIDTAWSVRLDHGNERASAVARLSFEFGEHVPTAAIERALDDAYLDLADCATVGDYLPLLALRLARNELASHSMRSRHHEEPWRHAG